MAKKKVTTKTKASDSKKRDVPNPINEKFEKAEAIFKKTNKLKASYLFHSKMALIQLENEMCR